MFKLFLLTTVAIAVVSAGRLRRNEPPTEKDIVESGLVIAQDGVKKLEEIATNLLSAKNKDELLERGGAIWDQVKSLASTITKTTQEWSDNTSIKEIREIAGSTVENIKSEHPVLTNAIAGSVESLNKVGNDIIDKLKLLIDDTDVKDVTNTLIDTASSGVTIVKEQLKDATQTLSQKLHKDEEIKDVANVADN
ncbi:hypothetical protein FF38_04507 [Lucilia cuprina]|uniref:Protein TsetseEP domain-containing protein n=1 Tax=Lucilia cuprina TaxID=7375 RepID=A0A0L0BRF8_LUCCU|nr:hypothetical protein CVS40_8236 [Lucilia cuprina]KNC22622.1 hypothetical protein FF38_04507 [Lucilia cuprina]